MHMSVPGLRLSILSGSMRPLLFPLGSVFSRAFFRDDISRIVVNPAIVDSDNIIYCKVTLAIG